MCTFSFWKSTLTWTMKMKDMSKNFHKYLARLLISFHNWNFFIFFFFTSLFCFFDPTQEKKAHSLSEKIFSTIQPFFRPILSRLQWILKLGLRYVFIHRQNPQSSCECVSERKKLRRGEMWEHEVISFSMNEWNAQQSGIRWFLLLIT